MSSLKLLALVKERQNSADWTYLPRELYVQIFQLYLKKQDRANARLVCKHWRSILDHPSLWKGKSIMICTHGKTINKQAWKTLKKRKVERFHVFMDKSSFSNFAVMFPKLTELNWCCPPMLPVETILSHCQDLSNLTVNFMELPFLVTDIRRVFQLKNLTSLTLEELCYTDTDPGWIAMNGIAELKNLQTLSLRTKNMDASYNPIPSEVIHHVLHSLPHLKNFTYECRNLGILLNALMLYFPQRISNWLEEILTPPIDEQENHEPSYMEQEEGVDAPPSMEHLQLESLQLPEFPVFQAVPDHCLPSLEHLTTLRINIGSSNVNVLSGILLNTQQLRTLLIKEPREKKEEWSWSCFPFTSDALPASLGTLGIYSHYMDVSALSSLLQASPVKHLKTLSLRTYFRSDQRNMTALREFPCIFSHLRELEIRYDNIGDHSLPRRGDIPGADTQLIKQVADIPTLQLLSVNKMMDLKKEDVKKLREITNNRLMVTFDELVL